MIRMPTSFRRARLTIAIALLLAFPGAPAAARGQGVTAAALRRSPVAHATEPRRAAIAAAPSGVRRARGAAIGAIAGAALGGALGASFAQGQCERSPCDEWRRGLAAGALVGAAIGALVGLAVAR